MKLIAIQLLLAFGLLCPYSTSSANDMCPNGNGLIISGLITTAISAGTLVVSYLRFTDHEAQIKKDDEVVIDIKDIDGWYPRRSLKGAFYGIGLIYLGMFYNMLAGCK